MSDTTDTAIAGTDTEAAAADTVVNVNGRKVGIAESGEIIAGPPAMKGQYIAPSQLAVLKDSKDYHGHLILSPTQEDIRLAEAELELMRGGRVKPEDVRGGMMITYNGVGGRIESISEAGDVATVNLGGAHRPIQVSKLIRDAEFHVDQTVQQENDLTLTEEEVTALLETEQEPEPEHALEADEYGSMPCSNCSKHMLFRRGKGKVKCVHCGKFTNKTQESSLTLSQESGDTLNDLSTHDLMARANECLAIVTERNAKKD